MRRKPADELVEAGYRALAGQLPIHLMSWNYLSEVVAAAHDDAQWREVPLRDAIEARILVLSLDAAPNPGLPWDNAVRISDAD